MSNPNNPENSAPSEPTESFDQLLSEYERSHAQTSEDGARRLEGTVVALTADSVLLDIGFKSEGIMPLADFPGGDASVKVGDKFVVSVKGRDADGYYLAFATASCPAERLDIAGTGIRRQDHRSWVQLPAW